MSIVFLMRCESYDYNTVKSAVKKGIELIGGPLKFASPQENFVKTQPFIS